MNEKVLVFRPKWRLATFALWIVSAAAGLAIRSSNECPWSSFLPRPPPQPAAASRRTVSTSHVCQCRGRIGRCRPHSLVYGCAWSGQTMQLVLFFGGGALLGSTILAQRGNASLAASMIVSFIGPLFFLSPTVILSIYIPELLPTKV